MFGQKLRHSDGIGHSRGQRRRVEEPQFTKLRQQAKANRFPPLTMQSPACARDQSIRWPVHSPTDARSDSADSKFSNSVRHSLISTRSHWTASPACPMSSSVPGLDAVLCPAMPPTRMQHGAGLYRKGGTVEFTAIFLGFSADLRQVRLHVCAFCGRPKWRTLNSWPSGWG